MKILNLVLICFMLMMMRRGPLSYNILTHGLFFSSVICRQLKSFFLFLYKCMGET